MVRNRYGKWKEHIWFGLFLAGMTGYYIWRLFRLAPWYDELYTYMNFIDRGVLYSMLHWPLPNNHILFSVCSAILNKLGNPYIGLRGVSLLASIGSFLLLYRYLSGITDKFFALAGCCIFGSMYNVTSQAVQGRGYALSGFLLLAALTLLYDICVVEETSKKKRSCVIKYLLFAGCLAGGLYTVPSNLYWVLPICLAGGIYLLLKKQYGKLAYLILASLAGAAVTVALYGIVWGVTGATVLKSDAAYGLAGSRLRYIMLDEPLTCLRIGLRQMLSNGFIQSIGRDAFRNGFSGYMAGLINTFYPGKKIVTGLVILAAAGCLLWKIFLADEKKDALLFTGIVCLVLILAVPVGITIQCVLPFTRIYTYLGSVLAILIVLAVYVMLPGKWNRVLAAAAVLLLVSCCHGASYNSGYSKWDTDIKAALDQLDETQVETVLVNDTYSQLNLYFHIKKIRGKELKNSYYRPDYMLVDNALGNYENGITERPWYDYRITEELPWDWIHGHMEKVYEGKVYTAYQVKKR